MKKLLKNTTKSAYKGIVFWTFFWLTVFSVAYAASITSTTQTVSSWDSITANWYQEVNNKIWGISVSGGNVGVGNNLPGWMFTIWDGIWWTHGMLTIAQDQGLQQVIRFTNWEGNDTYYPSWIWYQPNWRMEFRTNLWTTSSSEWQLVLQNWGNVWIWTTTPTSKLEVKYNDTWTLKIWKDNIGIYWWNSWGNLHIDSISNLYLNHYSNNSNTFIWWANVWIWTTAPTAKLEVAWDLKVTGNIIWTMAPSAPAAGTIVQTVVNTTETLSSLDTTSYTEANTNYRISFTPKYSNSKILVEYDFLVNTAMNSNTIYSMLLLRNIWTWSEFNLNRITANKWSRNNAAYVWRPFNWYDWNDMGQIHMVWVDYGLTAGQTYTYWFKYKRETWGGWRMYFNHSQWNNSNRWFISPMIMKITEIAQ